MSIKHWPDSERPREKLLDKGPGALSDAELLAVFLGSGPRGASAVDLARELLDAYGGLRPVLTAPQRELCARRGVGSARYVVLQAAVETGRRCLAQRMQRGEALTSPELTRTFLRSRMQDLPHELFCCLYLDTKHRVIRFEELFRGTIDGASVHPREVVRCALSHNAAAVIVAHNHPSGVAEPSAADNALTQRLKEALAVVDVRLLDHLVVGDGEVVSFVERGLL